MKHNYQADNNTQQNYSPAMSYLKSTALKIGFVAALAAATFAPKKSYADTILDPFPLVPVTPTLQGTIVNPHPTWGTISNIEAFDNGETLGILYSGGNVSFHKKDMSQEIGALGLNPGKGFTEVPASFGKNGGTIAVATTSGDINYFDRTGHWTGADVTNSLTSVLDIDWDAAHNRLLVRNGNGLNVFHRGGSLEVIAGTTQPTFDSVNMKEGYRDMFIDGRFFNQWNEDGTHNIGAGSKLTSFGQGNPINGIAFTESNGYASVAQGLFKYAKSDFQNFQDYSVPDPATIALMAVGGLNALRKARKTSGREIQSDNM